VAANSLLRARVQAICDDDGRHCSLPSPAMCTDNAAMVAAAGWWRLRQVGPSPLDTGARPDLGLPLVF
jgi:N6-L-threonylcarbamoyladenine synthase